MAHPEFSGDFNADNLSEHFELKLPLPALANGKPHYQPVDLSQYMTDSQGNSKRGMFLLSVNGYDPNKKPEEDDSENTQIEDKRLILITDLGVIAKTEHDGSQVVFCAIHPKPDNRKLMPRFRSSAKMAWLYLAAKPMPKAK